MKTRIVGPLLQHQSGRIILGRDDFDDRISLVEIISQRGDEPPLHRHRHEDLVVYVLDGYLTFQVDGHRVPVSPGSYILLPRGSEHGYAIESETAHLLVILAPAGAEGYLAELHGSAHAPAFTSRNGSCEAIERLVTNAARHGIDITGPPAAHGVENAGSEPK